MYSRQQVKTGAAWIRRQVKALGSQMTPSDILTSHKKQAEKHGYVEPAGRAVGLTPHTAHKNGDPAARDFQSGAAGEEQKGIEVEDRRQSEGSPVERRTFADHQSAGE